MTAATEPAEALTQQPPRPGAKCSVAVVLNALENPQNRERLAAILDGKDPEHTTPADATATVEAMGFKMSAAIVRRHRRRLTGRGEKCWCPA